MLKVIFLFSVLCTPLCAGAKHTAAVTYEFSGGRFGDNLLSYLHAKWVSYSCGVPLVYKPFRYSEQLVMDAKELHYDQVERNFFAENKLRGDLTRVISRIPFLYICPYFPETEGELQGGYYRPFPVDWNNEDFRKSALAMIEPKEPLALALPPEGTISVAIHIREGGGYDDGEFPLRCPLKSPPLSFYAQCLEKLYQVFLDRPLYCHVFTDAQEPKALVEYLERHVPPGMRISFRCREEGNRHDAHVLEDFFSLFHYDILIRPESNYSIIPTLLHSYMAVFYPVSFSTDADILVIDEIRTAFDTDLLIDTLFEGGL